MAKMFQGENSGARLTRLQAGTTIRAKESAALIFRQSEVRRFLRSNPVAKVRCGKFVLFGVIFVGAFLPAASAQEPEKEAPKATLLSLGAVSGAGKAQVMVPLFVTPYPAELPVGSISASLVYQSKGLTFVRAEKSFLLDGVGGVFQVQPAKDPDDPDKSILAIEVSTKGEPRKALREGLILTLVFKIDADAKPGTVSLDLQKMTASNLDLPPKPIQPLVSKSGTIEIVAPEGVPYVGCFFFSH
jgi:hypothetical protein